jgi:hypothetical protein
MTTAILGEDHAAREIACQHEKLLSERQRLIEVGQEIVQRGSSHHGMLHPSVSLRISAAHFARSDAKCRGGVLARDRLERGPSAETCTVTGSSSFPRSKDGNATKRMGASNARVQKLPYAAPRIHQQRLTMPEAQYLKG